MSKLEWSVLEQDNSITQPLVDMFKNVSPQTELQTHSIIWVGYKQELTNIAIYGRGADVSQVGAPLINDFTAMNALQPFSSRQVALLGGESAFTKIAWKNNSFGSASNQVWAVPLFSDPFAIVYWSDMLEKAGVDETQAFTSEHIEETFERLQVSGIKYPWLVSFHGNFFISVHGAASWIWSQDTDFISDDGKEALFARPEALAGLKEYYRLARFVSPACLQASKEECNQIFIDRGAAAVLCGVSDVWYEKLPAELQPLLKVALPPGPPLVGGSSLVIWNSTVIPDLAFNLVKFLVSPEVQAFYPLQVGQMPVRQEVFSQPPFSTNPFLQSYGNVLAHGRTFPFTKFSGLLEDQLNNALTNIWHTVLSDPGADLEKILLSALEPLARRYDRIIK